MCAPPQVPRPPPRPQPLSLQNKFGGGGLPPCLAAAWGASSRRGVLGGVGATGGDCWGGYQGRGDCWTLLHPGVGVSRSPMPPRQDKGTPLWRLQHPSPPPPPDNETPMQLRGLKGGTPMELEGGGHRGTHAPQDKGGLCRLGGPALPKARGTPMRSGGCKGEFMPLPPQDKGDHLKLGGMQRGPHAPPNNKTEGSKGGGRALPRTGGPQCRLGELKGGPMRPPPRIRGSPPCSLGDIRAVIMPPPHPPG